MRECNLCISTSTCLIIGHLLLWERLLVSPDKCPQSCRIKMSKFGTIKLNYRFGADRLDSWLSLPRQELNSDPSTL